jgi:hypothetical protein
MKKDRNEKKDEGKGIRHAEDSPGSSGRRGERQLHFERHACVAHAQRAFLKGEKGRETERS